MRSPVLVPAVVATVLCMSSALAGETPKPGPQKAAPAKSAAETEAAPQAGMVVFVDPVTKKVRQPTPEEIGQLVGTPKASALGVRPLEVRTLANGIVAVLLDPSFDSYSVAAKGPDGKLVMTCVDGKEKAEKTVAAGSAVPAQGALDEK